VFIGPEFGTVTRPDLIEAAREAADAGFDILIACAFNYEAHATEFEKLGKMSLRGASSDLWSVAVSLALRWSERRLVREEIYYTVWFNQPVGLAIRRRIYAPLYSGAELYQTFVSVTLFEPRQAAGY
jgi:hypothetical protein